MVVLKNLVLNFVLMAIAIVLFIVLLIPALITALIVFFAKRTAREGITSLGNLFLSTAIAIDQMGNTFCAELLNLTLQKGGYRFGNVDETISGVLGKNKVLGTLTRVGRALDWVLESLDPNHSIKSIEDDENH